MSIIPGSRPAAPLPRRPAVGRRRAADDAGMLLVCLIWGLNFSVTKFALAEIPPLPFTAIRFLAASLLLWSVLRLVEGPMPETSVVVKRLIVLGVIGNPCYQLAF